MEDLLQSALDIAIDSVATEVVDTVVEETIETTKMSTEDMAWGAVDVLLDTGAAEGIAALFGAPFAIIIGIKAFKKWRKKQKVMK